jgi:hypothetical protein
MNRNRRPDPDASLGWRLAWQRQDLLSHIRTTIYKTYDDVEAVTRSLRLEKLYRDSNGQRPRGTWGAREEV